jgi:hypothetical protein
MSIEEQRREAFEDWAERHYGGPVTRDDGEYFMPEWEREWLAWNAALDSVVIELPPALADDLTLIASIEAAGLKVKP